MAYLRRLWRRLTCGHGWHRWERLYMFDLDNHVYSADFRLRLGRACARCGAAE